MKRGNYVYLVGAANGPPYKVGHSANPEARLASYMAGSPHALAVLRKWERNGDARKVECLAHRKLRAFCVDREWFSASLDETIEAIERAIHEIDNPAPPQPTRSLLDLARELRQRGEHEAAEAVTELHNRKAIRKAVAQKAGAAFSAARAHLRERDAARWGEAKHLWLHDATLTGVEVAAKTGFSRSLLHREFGPRGTPKFGRKT